MRREEEGEEGGEGERRESREKDEREEGMCLCVKEREREEE